MRSSLITAAVLLLCITCQPSYSLDPDSVFLVFEVVINIAGVPTATGTNAYNLVFYNQSEAQNELNTQIAANTAQIISNPCTGFPNCAATNSVCNELTTSIVQCKCLSGYNQTASTTGFGPATPNLVPDGTNCPDIDECNGDTFYKACGVGTDQCFNSPGSYSCNCSSGYDQTSPTVCTDINECANSTLNDCDSNASCTNTNGSFTCACNPGYSGDGVTCTEFDECGLAGYDCGGAAAGSCANTVGSYVCTCNAGYTLNSATDPHVCQDNDECGGSPCNVNANCTNTPGSFTCACHSGYSGDGSTTCANIDECLSNPCNANATCTDTTGSFTCSCNSGFAGDGFTCTPAANDYAYRAVFSFADTSYTEATATTEATIATFIEEIKNATSLSYTSLAVTFVKSETNTTHVDVIVLLNFTASSKTADEFTALLVAHTSSLTIQTNTFTGNDYNECTTNFGNCSSLATCTNTNGDYTCACPNSLADTSVSGMGMDCALPFNFTCYSDRVEVWALNSFFGSKIFNDTFVRVGDCIATNDTASGYLKFSGSCSSTVTSNSSFIFYQWNLTNYNPSPVVTGQQFSYPITCSIPRSQNISSGNVSAEVDLINGDNVVQDVTDNIQYSIKIFTDQALTNELTGVVKTSQELYFKVFTTGTLPTTVKTQITSFYTTPVGDPNDQLIIVENGCPVAKNTRNSAIMDTFSFVSNGASTSQAVARVQAHFMGTSTVTVAHMTVELCDSATSTCTPTCTKKRKRSVTLRAKREVTKDAEVAFQRDPNDACNRNCERGICVLDVDRNQHCVCYGDTFKQSDGTCALGGNTNNIEEDRTTLWVLVGLAIALFFLIAILIAVFVMRKQTNNQKDFALTHVNTKAIH